MAPARENPTAIANSTKPATEPPKATQKLILDCPKSLPAVDV